MTVIYVLFSWLAVDKYRRGRNENVIDPQQASEEP